MSALNDDREMKILETGGILIKNQTYHVVLTSGHIIFTGDTDHKPRSIRLQDVQNIELNTDDSGNPEILVFALSASRETNKVILHFPHKNFPDALQQRYVWFSEINRILGQPARVSPPVMPKTVSPDPAFCSKCGKRLAEGSVFCDRCGAKMLFPARAVPQEQGIRDQVIPADLSGRKTAPPFEEPPGSYPYNPGAGDLSQGTASPHNRDLKRTSFFTRFTTRKPVVIVVSCLAVVLIAAFFVMPSISPGFNLTSPGMNFSIPGFNGTMPAIGPFNTTTTGLENPGNPAIPGQTAAPGVVSAETAPTPAPGEPAAVLTAYPSLFNSGNGAGLFALSSENIQSQYPVGDLNNELDVAHSNGNSIENIQVTNQIIEGNIATLIVEISWKTSESTTASTQNVMLVKVNGQWKLDTLILHP